MEEEGGMWRERMRRRVQSDEGRKWRRKEGGGKGEKIEEVLHRWRREECGKTGGGGKCGVEDTERVGRRKNMERKERERAQVEMEGWWKEKREEIVRK